MKNVTDKNDVFTRKGGDKNPIIASFNIRA